MKILNLKYKMHKFVNLVFYLIIFIFGFLLGFSVEKINFNKLISQFLLIDSVYAEELVGSNCQKNFFTPSITSGNYYGVDLTLNDDGSISLYGTANSFGFINLGYSDLPSENIPTENNEFCSSNNYCLPTIEKDLGYTKDNNIIWYIVYNGWFYDKTIYPMLTNGPSPSTYIKPGEEVCFYEKDTFYSFSQKIFGDLPSENIFIYDFITLGLVVVCFTLFVLIVGYIIKKFFGG